MPTAKKALVNQPPRRISISGVPASLHKKFFKKCSKLGGMTKRIIQLIEQDLAV